MNSSTWPAFRSSKRRRMWTRDGISDDADLGLALILDIRAGLIHPAYDRGAKERAMDLKAALFSLIVALAVAPASAFAQSNDTYPGEKNSGAMTP
jgi:hypothetical protein